VCPFIVFAILIAKPFFPVLEITFCLLNLTFRSLLHPSRYDYSTNAILLHYVRTCKEHKE
jgi:hypothetical protein